MSVFLEGPGAWLASRAAGVTAYLALSLELALGLFLSTGVADRWIARARSVELHIWLSRGTLALVVAHASALLLDRYRPFALLDLLVPFWSDYRPLAVGVGVLATWLVVAVHVSFSLRARLGQRVWRAMHYASFAAWSLATAHGVSAGSDGMPALYLGSGALLGALVSFRAFARAPAQRAAR